MVDLFESVVRELDALAANSATKTAPKIEKIGRPLSLEDLASESSTFKRPVVKETTESCTIL